MKAPTAGSGCFAAAAILLATTNVLAQAGGGALPKVTTLRDHVGAAEKVQLDVYFIGFPAELETALRAGVTNTLEGLNIVDAQPWWIPNIPKYGAAGFATTPAAKSLASTEVPPDGLLRYLPNVVGKQVAGNNVNWIPLHEIADLVGDWHQNADIVNYVEHEGSYRGVAWQIHNLNFHFLPQAILTDLVPQLLRSERTFKSTNPPAQVTLYSYNVLMDSLTQFGGQPFGPGGASLVFLNLPGLASNQPYSFYAEPARDVVPSVGVADSEVQYSAASATSSSAQTVETVMNTVLQGGLTQPKMLAALETTCAKDILAAGSGMLLPGMLPTQPLCQQWSLQPIRNLAGNFGRRIFVSDATSDIAAYEAGGATRNAVVNTVQQNAFELYRYGVLAPTIKANNVYSEAYELRTLVVDLRYDPIDLYILNALKQNATPAKADAQCTASSTAFPTEKTYQVGDVFDSGLAIASLSQFNPGSWTVTMQQLPFGLQPDGTVSAVQAAETKAALRQALNAPTLTNPATGQPVTLTHPPFYRTMMVPDAQNHLQTITTSWENGIDPVSIMSLLTLDASQGGLGVYTSVWPDAAVVGAPPYHQTGKPTVKPLALILTPPPDGPLGEKWGVFPYNLTALTGLGLISEYGGGGWWLSGGGNEEGGGLLRRDFSWVVPQYFAGPSRGNGDAVPMGVMPDGSVQPFPLTFLTARALEIGAPHWCNEFDSPVIAMRNTCRSFVKTTTTLQAIETLQHGLGYLHTAEPRYRYHFDGTESSFARLFQLIANPTDVYGQLLHQDVNMYTTAGLSTVWSQSVSEWNGVAPHAGMQASLFRSHAREEMAAAESALAQAGSSYQQGFHGNGEILGLLQLAAAEHDLGLGLYDQWDYRGVLNSAMQSLSLTSHALELMSQGDKLHDPLQIRRPTAASQSFVSIDKAAVEKAVQSITMEHYKQGSLLLNSH